MKLFNKLSEIQKALKAPKDQFNEFAKFPYRNCEGILEALKPLLDGLVVLITDEIIEVGGRVYIKATVSISDGVSNIEAVGIAREPLSKKGMDEAQVTGATSSYARKYALNGLFLIDDTKDADSVDNSEHVTLTENDNKWIVAVKDKPELLNTIEDLSYRAFIKREAEK